MKINELLNQENLKKMISDKYIDVSLYGNLRLYNYSHNAQFEGMWNKETLHCRGLIVDEKDNVVATPLRKFFNYDEETATCQHQITPDESFEVYDKKDGSLGILFNYKGAWECATRGSFTSDQSNEMRKIIKEKYSHIDLSPDYTYCFEIIYPQNRIVVDYRDTRDIFLLAAIKTGEYSEMSYNALCTLGFPVVKRFDGMKDFVNINHLYNGNEEGFVVKFMPSNFRVKMKFDEYKRLHKVMTGLSEKNIWEFLSAGQSLDPLLERVPDEFYRWLKRTEEDLRLKFVECEAECKHVFKDFGDRKTNAFYYLEYPRISSVLFQMLDKKPYEKTIWKMLKPEKHVTFKVDLDS